MEGCDTSPSAIVPRPQINLLIYHDVLAPNSHWRKRVVAYGYDVNARLECGGRKRLIAMIEEPAVIAKILSHLGLPTEPSQAQPARPPPEQLELPELIEAEIDGPIDEPAFDC